MDIFLHDPADIPLPPEEVRILSLRAEPWPDGRRVRISMEITPFQKRPSGEIRILNSQGEEVSSFAIIETIDPKMQFTIHLRESHPGGQYTASATLFYTSPIPEPGIDQPSPATLKLPDSLVVDRAAATFEV